MFFKGPREVLTYYLLSLAVADLLVGVLVVPLSVYPTLVHHWMYGDVLCKASGYLGSVLWTASVYTLMWMSVDRYVAVRKPIRYEVVQTRTRIQCWVAVSWVSALMLCCPPLLGWRGGGASYDKEAAVCLLDWNVMPAYAATLASLILGSFYHLEMLVFHLKLFWFRTILKGNLCFGLGFQVRQSPQWGTPTFAYFPPCANSSLTLPAWTRSTRPRWLRPWLILLTLRVSFLSFSFGSLGSHTYLSAFLSTWPSGNFR